MLYRPKQVPLNWYKYDVRFSVELLEAYIRGVEQQVLIAIEEYRSQKEVIISEEIPEEGSTRIVEAHRGLDSETWNLGGIFEDYFPNLQRRGALITLYSFLEHEINGLCELFMRVDGITVSPTDMRGTGVDCAVLFLVKVVGLQIDKSTTGWQEIRNIQKIRNLIVHNDGKLRDRSGKEKLELAKYVADSPCLSGDDEIRILPGYLSHVLEAFDRQFQEIDRLIAARSRA